MQEEHGMARMQELLSSYYGIQDEQTEAQSMRNIDSPGFDASTYVKDMLQTQGLNDLLQRDDQLIREIKELDTSMQMLVYENYNKFISATDTIRKMKNNVASMEDEVERVVASMDVITDKSESINVALAPHRSKVEKLIGVRRLLKRLEFIFELPQRLNAAVKKEEYANATKYFLLARRILGRYEHISSFKAIQIEADKIIRQLEQTLSRKLSDSSLSSDEICEATSLLQQLGSCTPELRQQFLDWHQEYFERTVAIYKSIATDESVLHFLKRCNEDMLAKMMKVYSIYTKSFLADAHDKTSAHSTTPGRDDSFLGFVKETFGLYLCVCENQFRRPFKEFGSLDEVLAMQNESEDDDAVNYTDAGDDEYFVLMRVLKYFLSHAKQAHALVPMGRLAPQAIEAVETCIRVQIDSVFNQLRQDTVALIGSMHEEASRASRAGDVGSVDCNVQPLGRRAATQLKGMMQVVLEQMEPLVLTGTTHFAELHYLFSDLVQSQFYQFLTWFNATVLLYTEPKRAFDEQAVAPPWLEPSPPFVLFMACMCRDVASDGIGECVRTLIEILPGGGGAAFPGMGDAAARKKMSQVDVTHMIEVTRETSMELVQFVARHYGNQLCAVLAKGISVTTWATVDEEPRSVQEMVIAVVEATFRFGKEVALALGDTQSLFASGSNSRNASRDALRRRSGGALKSRGVNASGMSLDVERIFAKQIQIFSPHAELVTEWFVAGMLKMAVKAFGEWLRVEELSKFALQQVQLNAEFLRSAAVHLLASPEELESLLSDMLSNARERAVEDVLMEPSSVVAIVSTRSAQVLSRRL